MHREEGLSMVRGERIDLPALVIVIKGTRKCMRRAIKLVYLKWKEKTVIVSRAILEARVGTRAVLTRLELRASIWDLGKY